MVIFCTQNFQISFFNIFTIIKHKSNTKIESYKRLFGYTTVKQNTWVMLSIPHGLGTIPNFMIATPQSLSAGRIYWITRADETNIAISIYSSDPGEYAVGFYVLCA